AVRCQLPYQAGLQPEHPGVQRKGTAAVPSLLDRLDLHEMPGLRDGVEGHHAVDALGTVKALELGLRVGDCGGEGLEPGVESPAQALAGDRRGDASAAGMPAHDDVLDL